MVIDLIPEVIHSSTAVSSHGKILVHERRTSVLRIESITELMLDRRWITRTDYVFGRMNRRIAAIHPESCRVISSSFRYDLIDIETLAALVSCTPEKHARMVPVAKDHPSHPFLVHFRESRQRTHIFGRMSLISRLVDDI